MRRGLIFSFLAAAGFHAVLLFGFQASGPVLHPVGSAAGPLEVALVGGGAPGEAGPPPSSTESAPPESPVAPTEKPPEPAVTPEPPLPDAVAVAASTPTPTPTPQPELAPAPVNPQPVAHAAPSPQTTKAPKAEKTAVHHGKASTIPVSARSGGASAGTGASTGLGGGEGGLGGGAQLRGHPRPEYPPQARRERQEGVALVKVRVGADGLPMEVSLARSSGFPLLDDAAVRGVRRWTFDPARTAGVPVPSQVEVPVRFNLLP